MTNCKRGSLFTYFLADPLNLQVYKHISINSKYAAFLFLFNNAYIQGPVDNNTQNYKAATYTCKSIQKFPSHTSRVHNKLCIRNEC